MDEPPLLDRPASDPPTDRSCFLMLTISNTALAESPTDSLRRYSTRYEPTRRDACLSWWEAGAEPEATAIDSESPDEPEAEQQFALLLDISQTGASIALDRVPRPENGVRLRLEGESLGEWTEAEVVGVTTTARGPHLVRLAFRAPCPFETLRAAIFG
jgi:hypothetical protein